MASVAETNVDHYQFRQNRQAAARIGTAGQASQAGPAQQLEKPLVRLSVWYDHTKHVGNRPDHQQPHQKPKNRTLAQPFQGQCTSALHGVILPACEYAKRDLRNYKFADLHRYAPEKSAAAMIRGIWRGAR